jgi:N-acetyl-anhydromuramyl-L-alanine amidase AmpD
VEEIDRWHAQRGFHRPVQTEPLKHIGYQYYIRKNGTICKGRHEDEVGAHCRGYNSHSVGICYEGGLDDAGEIADTRTEVQKTALLALIKDVQSRWDIKQIMGHRDTSPDLNHDGIIEEDEWIKGCPCFDAIPEYAGLLQN